MNGYYFYAETVLCPVLNFLSTKEKFLSFKHEKVNISWGLTVGQISESLFFCKYGYIPYVFIFKKIDR